MKRLSPFIYFSILLLLLEAVVVGAKLSPAAFAKPSEVLWDLQYYVVDPQRALDVLSTVYRTIVAFVFSLVLGSFVGILVHKLEPVRTENTILLDFLRSIPATALVPLFLVIFGTGDSGKIAAGIFSGSLAMALAVVIGLQRLDINRKVVADLLGISGFTRLIKYELREITPSFLVGTRTAASLCLILVVVGEMSIGSQKGLGRLIMDMRYSDNIPTLYSAILLTGIIGWLLNRFIEVLSKRFT